MYEHNLFNVFVLTRKSSLLCCMPSLCISKCTPCLYWSSYALPLRKKNKKSDVRERYEHVTKIVSKQDETNSRPHEYTHGTLKPPMYSSS